MYYAIRVQGHLSSSWQSRFGGLCIEQQEGGTTLLSGTLPDQAALHGVLLQVIRLGLTLISLETGKVTNEVEAKTLLEDDPRGPTEGKREKDT
jgi:hypothetical protein